MNPKLNLNLKPKPTSPDIYNWETRYNSTLERLQGDSRIIERNRARLKAFLESRVARGLSVARVVKYANHLIVVGRLCSKDFDEMTAEDVRGLLVALKSREKEQAFWTQARGTRYSEHTLSDIKSMLKVFWRWMKGWDESKPNSPHSSVMAWVSTPPFSRLSRFLDPVEHLVMVLRFSRLLLAGTNSLSIRPLSISAL